MSIYKPYMVSPVAGITVAMAHMGKLLQLQNNEMNE